MNSWFDWSGMNATLSSMIELLAGLNVALIGILFQWTDAQVAAGGVMAALAVGVVFKHLKIWRRLSRQMLVWVVGLLSFLSLILYGFAQDWLTQLENWLKYRRLKEMTENRYLATAQRIYGKTF